MPYFRIHDLGSVGMQQSVDDLITKNNELREIRNANISRIGTVRSVEARSFLTQHAANAETYPYQGLHAFDDGTYTNLYGVHQGDLYVRKPISPYDYLSWSAMAYDQFSTTRYATFADLVYTNASGDLTNAFAITDTGNSAVAYTNGIVAPAKIAYSDTLSTTYLFARTITSLNNILFAGHIIWDNGSPVKTYKNRVYYTQPGTFKFYAQDSEKTDVELSTNWVEVDGDVVSVHTVGRYIAIFADDIWILDPGTLTLDKIASPGIGSVTAANVYKDILYWINATGCYVWDGSGSALKISSPLEGAHGSGNLGGGVWENVLFFQKNVDANLGYGNMPYCYYTSNELCFNVPTYNTLRKKQYAGGFYVPDDNHRNMTLKFNIQLKAWTIQEGDIISGFAHLPTSAPTVGAYGRGQIATVLAANTNSNNALSNTTSFYLLKSDADFGIENFSYGGFYIETNSLYMGSVETQKSFEELIIHYKARGTATKISYCIDERIDEWYTVCESGGAVELPASEMSDGVTLHQQTVRFSLDSVKGFSIKLAIQYDAPYYDLEIMGISIRYKELNFNKDIG